MARPSKLTERQWEELTLRNLQGESLSKLAKEFGIAKGAVSERFKKKNPEHLKAVAHQKVAVEKSIDELSVIERRIVNNLADELRAISMNMASTAKNQAVTSRIMSAAARKQAEKVDQDNPMGNPELLQVVAACTKVVNDASVVPLALMKENREAMQQHQEFAPLPLVVVDRKGDAA
jgi:predicted DNA-binding protein YlxM (UPF0122 family)